MSRFSSFSSSRSGWTYDVFLSFRGEDTRKNFADHLYTGFVQAGIYTFRDDDELPRREEIAGQLVKAIQESRISIVLFSRGYASSRWCLNELVEILDCKNMNSDQIVLPIFYDIDPSDVRKQTGSFKEAFDKHEERFKEEMDKVNKWGEALVEAGNLSGWSLLDMVNGYESKFIKKIVEQVLTKLNPKYLNVASHPVGIDSHVKKIISLLNTTATNDAHIVGIHGIAGIGKTTIAKAVFNELCHGFDGSCFLFNINESSESPGGQVQLQRQLLRDILGWKISMVLDISNADRGITLIKERLGHKRVLVVLDDVDQQYQLDTLMAERDWYGFGSRVIITTRNEELLDQLKVVKYHAKNLNPDESLQLFRFYAFRGTHPKEEFLELSEEVVDYCRRLPLALKVLGSHFSLLTKPEEWRDEIEKLQKIPKGQMLEILKTSFDRLDPDVQGIFLDIAFFFVGREKDYVATILQARCRDFDPKRGFKTLIQRSFITINSKNEIRMHDLLRDMGREIIRKTSPYHPGERSRIWRHADAWDVLDYQMGTKNVEGLVLDARASKVEPLRTESFKRMTNLQLLQINGVDLTGDFKNLSKVLIWLCWHECPLKFLLPNFQLKNLIVLDMQHSNITELWIGTKSLNKLKILNLSYSKHLAKTPDLHSSSLHTLMLKDCSSLVKVDESIRHLEQLVLLNLEGCCRLKNLPEIICEIKSLETLNINRCSRLEKLPECLDDLKSLTELLADGTAITQLPSSIGNLNKLRKVSLGRCSYKQDRLSPSSNSNSLLPASFFRLSSLRELNLSNRGLSEGTVSFDFGSLFFLKELNLSGNKFFSLPYGIGHHPMLKHLLVNDCKNLQSIEELPLGLNQLEAHDCTSMERLSMQPKARMSVNINGCENLVEIQGMEGLADNWFIYSEDCNNLSSNFKKRLVQRLCKGKEYDFVLAGGDVPEWFEHRVDNSGNGSSLLSFRVSAGSDDILEALVVWVVWEDDPSNKRNYYVFGYVVITDESSGTRLFECETELGVNADPTTNQYSWVYHIPLTELPDVMEAAGCDSDDGSEDGGDSEASSMEDGLDNDETSEGGRDVDKDLKGGLEWVVYVEVYGRLATIEKCGVHLIAKSKADGEKWEDSQGSVEDGRWESYLMDHLPEFQICRARLTSVGGRGKMSYFLNESLEARIGA